MISYEQFLNTIKAETVPFNPDRFYFENLRTHLNASYTVTRDLVQDAIRDGHISRQIGLIGEGGNIIARYRSENEIPETITVESWDAWDDCEEEKTLDTMFLGRIEIFSIK